MTTSELNLKRFQRWSFLLLTYTVLVILWGAWVRISHSGDGCGDTWPLCHGQIIPEAQKGKTWVEFGHRLMSGAYGIFVLLLWFKARQFFSKDNLCRLAAFATLVFMIIEALLGAKLVLFKLVTTNDTPYRAFVMGLHQVNSFLLTGSIALTYFATLHSTVKPLPHFIFKKFRFFPLVIIAIGVTGAWAALSNSLFPSENLLDGVMADFSSQSHFLVRLRLLHPLFAVIGAGGLALFFWLKAQTLENKNLQKNCVLMSLTLTTGVLFGMATLFFHAPTWMKIAHLSLAHVIWVLLLHWIFVFNQRKNI